MIESITPKLLGEKPNTYTYTKQLAESLLIHEGSDLPLAIVRPSIVTAAWREPVPVSEKNMFLFILRLKFFFIFPSFSCENCKFLHNF